MKKLALAVCLASLWGCSGGEESEKSTPSKGSANAAAPTTTVGLRQVTMESAEGQAGMTVVNIAVQANRVVDTDLTIAYVTEDGSAKAGTDYVATKGEIILRRGTREIEIPVQLIGNTIHQSHRDFKFILTGVTGGTNVVKGTNDALVFKILDDDPEPVVTFSKDKTLVAETIGSVTVDVSLDRPSDKPTTVRLKFSGLATLDTDYRVSSTDIVIPPRATTGQSIVSILEDKLIEGTEDIRVAMDSVTNGKIGSLNTTLIYISGDLKLPDTGVTRFYDSGRFNSNAPSSAFPYQDALYGLDTNVQYRGNGYAGFVYEKIDLDGNALPASATNERCIFDNHTGLTWEVKGTIEPMPDTAGMDKNGVKEAYNNYARANWNSKGNRYLWNNPDPKRNGGNTGGINNKEFESEPFVSENCTFPDANHPLHVNVKGTGCTSNKYIELVNKAGLCGYKDWRLPNILELTTLINYESGETYLDGTYFKDVHYLTPTANREIRYFSATPSVDNSASAMCIDAKTKSVVMCHKQSYHFLRLVRGPQL